MDESLSNSFEAQRPFLLMYGVQTDGEFSQVLILKRGEMYILISDSSKTEGPTKDIIHHLCIDDCQFLSDVCNKQISQLDWSPIILLVVVYFLFHAK